MAIFVLGRVDRCRAGVPFNQFLLPRALDGGLSLGNGIGIVYWSISPPFEALGGHWANAADTCRMGA
jgi:hypothetical protein